MKTKNLDIVYNLKEETTYDEFRYSLRSLENIPHKRVFVFGGCPNWATNVIHKPFSQLESTKWDRSAGLLKRICEDKEITKNFIWFNDDFYVLKPIESLDYYYDRTLAERVADFRKMSMWGLGSRYSMRLESASYRLRFEGYPTKNFELHVPIIFNREKLLEIFNKYPQIGARRSLYGNTYISNPKEMKDIKIHDLESIPNENDTFVSTSNASFRAGKIGEFLKETFNKPSIYERTDNVY